MKPGAVKRCRERGRRTWVAARGLWASHPNWVTLFILTAVLASLIGAAPDGSVIRAGDPSGLYTAVVTGSAALAALGLVPMSIIISMRSPRVPLLMRKVSLARTIRTAVCFHLLTALLSVIGIALDSGGGCAGHVAVLFRSLTVALFAVAMEASLRVTTEFLVVLQLHQSTDVTIGELPPIE